MTVPNKKNARAGCGKTYSLSDYAGGGKREPRPAEGHHAVGRGEGLSTSPR